MRAALGRAYTRAWHRWTPRSAAALPRLPHEPLSRRYGMERGRPVDRVLIERFLAQHAGDIRGRCVEVYEPTYVERFGAASRVDVLDADPGSSRATIRGDFAALHDGAFDCFVCTQTVHQIVDAAGALREVRRALAPGGVLLLTVPGISQILPDDPTAFPDVVHYTVNGLRSAFGDWADVDVRSAGNVRLAAAFLYGLAEHEVDPGAFAEEADDAAYPVVVCARAVA